MRKNCFQFLFGLTIIVPREVENNAMQNFGETTKNNIIVPREIENNSYAKFWRDNKEYYGLFEKGIIIFM